MNDIDDNSEASPPHRLQICPRYSVYMRSTNELRILPPHSVIGQTHKVFMKQAYCDMHVTLLLLRHLLKNEFSLPL